jgi:hypothetical protein
MNARLPRWPPWPSERLPVEEYPQTVPNLTAATSNLFDLISVRQIVLYPDAAACQSPQRLT